MRTFRTLLGAFLMIVAVSALAVAASLDTVTWIATCAGAATLAAAIAALPRRDRPERPDRHLVAAERDRVIEFADLVAQRLSGQLAGTWGPHRRHEVTGEHARVPAARDPAVELPYVHSAT
jgi:hypothetical protein